MHPASVARGGGKAINVSFGRLIDRNTEALDVLLPDALHAVPLTPDAKVRSYSCCILFDRFRRRLNSFSWGAIDRKFAQVEPWSEPWATS